MSRTTTDDCLEHCPNHFNLAYHAAIRAKQIVRRGDALVPERNDKSVVVALREIARGLSEVKPMSVEKGDQTEEKSAAAEESLAASAEESSGESSEEAAAESSAGE